MWSVLHLYAIASLVGPKCLALWGEPNCIWEVKGRVTGEKFGGSFGNFVEGFLIVVRSFWKPKVLKSGTHFSVFSYHWLFLWIRLLCCTFDSTVLFLDFWAWIQISPVLATYLQFLYEFGLQVKSTWKIGMHFYFYFFSIYNFLNLFSKKILCLLCYYYHVWD